jgi:hypothetical protein
METLFPTVLDVPEPNDHTFDDHYRMTSQELDLEDALEPLHDEMMLRKAWLILELMPMKRMWQERGRWKSTFWWVGFAALSAFTAADAKSENSLFLTDPPPF